MKFYTRLLLSTAMLICLCACSAENTVSRDEVIINLPSDSTVNGYLSSSTSAVSSGEASVSVSTAADDKTESLEIPSSGEDSNIQYHANTNSKVFHRPDCSSAKNMKNENRLLLSSRTELIELGYTPCKRCKP